MHSTKVPVTILTGFLGSGKTTLLNYVLHQPHGQRIAVIENEFGEAGVDHELLVQEIGEQIIEMNNGCLCCTVRDDLIRILGELAERQNRGEVRFDRVLIETTGLADPSPVAQTFFMNEEVRAHYRLDGIVTLVDAKHASRQLNEHTEAQSQVGFADRLLISKTDLVEPSELIALEQRLYQMNPRAKIKQARHGQIEIDDVLNIRGFDMDAALEIYPVFSGGATHRHDDTIGSMVFRSERPLDAAELEYFMRGLLHQHGDDLLRYKGVLNLKDESDRIIIQGVQALMGSSTGRPWTPTDKRESLMVFIGRNLPREMIDEGLRSCVAG